MEKKMEIPSPNRTSQVCPLVKLCLLCREAKEISSNTSGFSTHLETMVRVTKLTAVSKGIVRESMLPIAFCHISHSCPRGCQCWLASRADIDQWLQASWPLQPNSALFLVSKDAHWVSPHQLLSLMKPKRGGKGLLIWERA